MTSGLAGCGKKANEGLPPATDWQSGDSAAGMAQRDPQKPKAASGQGDPHAGFGDPHAGVPGAPPIGGGEDPHAGMGGNPHAGGGVDVTQLGLQSPDPSRPIDPSRRVKGVLKVHPSAKGKVAAGGAIFLIVKRADANGAPSGPPLAVEKVSWVNDAMPFELTEANAMVAGTELTGDVIVSARYDQDSDAISKQPGDVTGQVRVKVPADKVELVLDTVLP
ncbi:MAG: c-type cytochrome biogenesis protein CcmI/CycH [Kofleriaceae bacterium]